MNLEEKYKREIRKLKLQIRQLEKENAELSKQNLKLKLSNISLEELVDAYRGKDDLYGGGKQFA